MMHIYPLHMSHIRHMTFLQGAPWFICSRLSSEKKSMWVASLWLPFWEAAPGIVYPVILSSYYCAPFHLILLSHPLYLIIVAFASLLSPIAAFSLSHKRLHCKSAHAQVNNNQPTLSWVWLHGHSQACIWKLNFEFWPPPAKVQQPSPNDGYKCVSLCWLYWFAKERTWQSSHLHLNLNLPFQPVVMFARSPSGAMSLLGVCQFT